MISPTVGRIVWVRQRPGCIVKEQPEFAKIVGVCSDAIINVRGADYNGVPFVLTSLHLKQDGEPDGQWDPKAPYAEWMPYQKGQAAKTEQLEAAARSSMGDEKLA